MKKGTVVRRVVALHLLLGFPLVAGSRLALDTLSGPESYGTVETHHSSGCVRLHDHGLCSLLLRSPWSRSPTTPRLAASSTVVSTALSQQEDQRPAIAVRLRVARSPPIPA